MSEGVTFYFDWEVRLIEFLQAHMGAFAVSVAEFFTVFGESLILVGIMAFLYWAYDKNTAKRICLNLLLALCIGPMIKNVVFRRRPYFDNEGIMCLRPVEADADLYDIKAQGYSFPSGHSTCAASCYPGLARYYKRPWLIAIGVALPIMVAVSRFCLGVHYPTDTLAGLALGCILSFATPKLYDRYIDKWWFMLAALAVVTPGLFYCHTDDYFSGYGMILGAVLGFIFEHRFVNFESTRKPLYMILRTLLGLGVFLLFAQGLKLVLPANTLTRVIRYAVGTFVAMGPYPMLFKRFEKPSAKMEELKA